MKLGYPEPKRKNVINQASESSSSGTWQVPVAGKQERLPTFTVSVELPKYRINNGRTLSAQEEYIADKGLNGNYFTEADLEKDSIQRVQHDILKNKITKTDRVNIINKFKTVRQNQPLLLTHNGFVLNGNRRLCAIREVYYPNTSKYNHFKDIEVVALPYLEERQLQEIEAALQIKDTWKQDYAWIDTTLLYKRQTDLEGLTPADIADRDKIKVQEVVETIRILDEVDKYLSWIGKPKKYSLAKNEHNFRLIVKNWDKLKKPGEKDLLRNLTFQLTKNEHEGGRTYGFIPHIPKAMPLLITNIAKDLGKDLNDLEALNTAVKVKTKNRADMVVEATINTIEAFQAKTKKTKEDEACIKAIRSANAQLEAAKNFRTKTSKLPGLTQQITRIEASLREIKKWK